MKGDQIKYLRPAGYNVEQISTCYSSQNSILGISFAWRLHPTNMLNQSSVKEDRQIKRLNA